MADSSGRTSTTEGIDVVVRVIRSVILARGRIVPAPTTAADGSVGLAVVETYLRRLVADGADALAVLAHTGRGSYLPPSLPAEVVVRVVDTGVPCVYQLFSIGGAALGSLCGGLVARAFGLTAPFWIAFAAMVVVTAVARRLFTPAALGARAATSARRPRIHSRHADPGRVKRTADNHRGGSGALVHAISRRSPPWHVTQPPNWSSGTSSRRVRPRCSGPRTCWSVTGRWRRTWSRPR